MVCRVGVVVVGVVVVGGVTVKAMCWLCYVFVVLCGFVLDYDILVLFLPHFLGGLTGTGTWSVCLSTAVSFPL